MKIFIFILLLPFCVLARNHGRCKQMNPLVDHTRHPDSDPQCQDGVPGWGMDPECLCDFIVKGRDSRGCHMGYYSYCKMHGNFAPKTTTTTTPKPTTTTTKATTTTTTTKAPETETEFERPKISIEELMARHNLPKQNIPERPVHHPHFPELDGTCAEQREQVLKEMEHGLTGYPLPDCTPDGKWKKTQCSGGGSGSCWCVDENTGEEIEVSHLSIIVKGMQGFRDCEKAGQASLKEEHAVLDEKKAEEMREFMRDTDPEVAPLELPPPIQVPENFPPQPGTPCCDARKIVMKAYGKGLRDYPIPTCTKDGRYDCVQCGGIAGQCWCVNQDTGIEIPGTRQSGRPTCFATIPKPPAGGYRWQ